MFLDIAIGIFAAFLVGYFYNFDPSLIFITTGILFNLLPDLDAIIFLIRNKFQSISSYHRDLFHKPLLFLITGLIIYFYNQPYGLLFLITTLAHFVHDSIGIGWGVKWLWPFKSTHYAFFYLYSPPGKKIPRKILYSWDKPELDKMIREYGDNNWIENIYFKFHPYAIVEYAAFIIAIGALISYFAN